MGCRPHSASCCCLGAWEAAGPKGGRWPPPTPGTPGAGGGGARAPLRWSPVHSPGGGPARRGTPGTGRQHSPLKLGSVRSHVGLTKYWMNTHVRMTVTHSMPASAKATEPRKNLRGQGHGLRRAPAAPPRGSQHLPRALGDLASPGPRSPPAAPLPQDQRQPWLDVTPARGWGCRGAAPSSQRGSETGDPALAAWATSAFSRATRPASSPSSCSDPEPRVASQPAGGVGAREPCGRTSGPLFCRGAGRAVPGPSRAPPGPMARPAAFLGVRPRSPWAQGSRAPVQEGVWCPPAASPAWRLRAHCTSAPHGG